MGRRVDLDNLVGAKEIVVRLGLKRTQRLYDLKHRHPDFPAPVRRLSVGNLWLWTEVETWARKAGRL